MKSKLIHEVHGLRTFAVVLDMGDEVSGSLQVFAEAEVLSAAKVTAIGAFESATLAFWDWDTKAYRDIPVREQVEVLSLSGDITLDSSGKPKLHLHTVLGRCDGSARGGHLKEAVVRPTLEVMVTESPEHLRRKEDPKTGLALIDSDA